MNRSQISAGIEDDVAPGEHNVSVVRSRCVLSALPTPNVVPVFFGDADAIGAGGNAHRAVVLLGAAQLVREVGGGDDVIELCRRLIALGGPRGAAVGADRRPAVLAGNHRGWAMRADP